MTAICYLPSNVASAFVPLKELWYTIFQFARLINKLSVLYYSMKVVNEIFIECKCHRDARIIH